MTTKNLHKFPKLWDSLKKEQEKKKKPYQVKDFILFKDIFSVRNIDDILFLMALKLNPS